MTLPPGDASLFRFGSQQELDLTTKAHATRFSGLSPFLLAALLLGGCEAKGVDPPTDRLFNPVALAVDPQGAFLLVANGDFGLAYNSASVTPVDLREVGRQLDIDRKSTRLKSSHGRQSRMPSSA